MFNQKGSSKMSLSTLNLALPKEVPTARSSSSFHPRLPPKKQCGMWSPSGDLAGLTSPSPPARPGVLLQVGGPHRSHTDSEITGHGRKRQVKPLPSLHVAHRIGHLNREIAESEKRGGAIVAT